MSSTAVTMNFRTYLVTCAIATLLSSLVAVAFIYTVDPLWCFGHLNRFNLARKGYNERQQKTDEIRSRGVPEDVLLLGSSHVTYLDPQAVPEPSFNYAVSGMRPEEYDAYLEYAKKHHGREFKQVILALDFWGTSVDRDFAKIIDPPGHYFDRADGALALWQMNFSMDALQCALADVQMSSQVSRGSVLPFDYYRHDGSKYMPIPSAESLDAAIKKGLLDYGRRYGENYRANPRYQTILRELRAHNPHTRFSVYLAPEAAPLFREEMTEGRFNDYERWISDAVGAFDTVTDFSGINSVTSTPTSFIDTHHYRPQVGRWILHRVLGTPDPTIPPDFGVVVTRDTLARRLEAARAQSRF